MSTKETALVETPGLDKDDAALEKMAATNEAVDFLEKAKSAEAAELVDADVDHDAADKTLEDPDLGIDHLHVANSKARGAAVELDSGADALGPVIAGECRGRAKDADVEVTAGKESLEWNAAEHGHLRTGECQRGERR
jgi:hypothetical protein